MNGAAGTVTGPLPSAGLEHGSGAGSACQPCAHRLYAEMGAQPSAVPHARRCARQALTAWKLGDIADDIELVVSEIVTNAVRATLGMRAAAPVALYLALDRRGLYVLAWDCCPELPVLRAHADDAESGRGLELVSALSDEWGTCACAEGGGKVTWARFEVRGQRA
jgi:anti-sigma regulatory factor (Ser/Thr protein kinase)